MKHRHLILLAVVTLAVLASMREARADMGPPEPPEGGAIGVDGEPSTYVRMVSEDVLVTVGNYRADVRATFNMLNMGEDEEILEVRFPAGYNWREPFEGGDEYVIWGLDIDSFVVNVDGERTDVAIDNQPDELRVWAIWQVIFPPGQPVKVEVAYRAPPDSWQPHSIHVYEYILETGAGWYGTIGEGTVTFRMPYEINKDNMYDEPSPDYYSIEGTDIIWQFADLEPTSNDNISVGILSPPLWSEWQVAEEAVAENPDSVSAHLRLAYAMSSIAHDGGTACANMCEFGQKAVQEYALWLNVIPNEYALQVIPDIVEYHLDYIDWMWFLYDQDMFCTEVERVIALALTDKRVVENKDRWLIYGMCSQGTPNPTATLYAPPGCDPQAGRCPPPTLTPTSTSRPTRTPGPTRTSTIAPTLTPTQMLTPTPNPQPPSPSLTVGMWVAIAAVVIGGAWFGVWAYRRKVARE